MQMQQGLYGCKCSSNQRKDFFVSCRGRLSISTKMQGRVKIGTFLLKVNSGPYCPGSKLNSLTKPNKMLEIANARTCR